MNETETATKSHPPPPQSAHDTSHQATQTTEHTASPTSVNRTTDKMVQEVIQAAFAVNKTILTEDDPMTAALVLQMHRFDKAIKTLQLRDFRNQRIFADKFKTEADKVMSAVEKTEQLRKEMLIELLSAHQSAVDEAEKRIYNSVLNRWDQNIQKLASVRMKFLTLAVILIVVLQLILLVSR